MKLHIHVTTIKSGATEVLTESDGVQAAGTALGLGDLPRARDHTKSSAWCPVLFAIVVELSLIVPARGLC